MQDTKLLKSIIRYWKLCALTNQEPTIDGYMERLTKSDAMELVNWKITFDSALPMGFWGTRDDWRGFIMVYDHNKRRWGKLFNFHKFFARRVRNDWNVLKVHLGTLNRS